MKYLVGLLFVIPFSSCVQDCSQAVRCSWDIKYIRTYGYSYSELDTIILKWYKAGSNFDQPIEQHLLVLDSTTIPGMNVYYANYLDAVAPKDSLTIQNIHYLHEIPDLATADDVEVNLVSLGRTHRISDILLDGPYEAIASRRCDEALHSPPCHRKLASCKVDGVVMQEIPVLTK